jgi:hypothetical protein
MPSPPHLDRGPLTRWSWVQFAFGFVIGGFVAFLNIAPPLDGLWPHLTKSFVVAGACGCVAGRFGDAAWHAIVRFLPWL